MGILHHNVSYHKGRGRREGEKMTKGQRSKAETYPSPQKGNRFLLTLLFWMVDIG